MSIPDVSIKLASLLYCILSGHGDKSRYLPNGLLLLALGAVVGAAPYGDGQSGWECLASIKINVPRHVHNLCSNSEEIIHHSALILLNMHMHDAHMLCPHAC